MAKMTISELKTRVASYVKASEQAVEWKATNTAMTKVLDKIAKMVTIDGNFNDKLPELSGDNLEFGKTIEEYYIDLTLPEDYNKDATTENVTPARPTVEDVAYSYALGRTKIKTTMPYGNLEYGCHNAGEFADMAASIMSKFQASQSLYEFNLKKQLLANVITKAEALPANVKGNIVKTVAKPVDTATSEAFIQKIKEAAEDASFASETNNLGSYVGDVFKGQYLIGAAPSLVLYIKKGVMPTIQVQALAGAIQKEELALGVTVKVVDDFGSYSGNTYALLVDPRGVKLHNGYNAVRSQELADSDAINYVRHTDYTGFISKSTFVRVFTA